MMRSDSLATNCVSRSNRPRCAPDNALAEIDGAILARQRISSAIQFPIPTNPLCSSSTALIGARAWRLRNASRNPRSNFSEEISGPPVCHQSGLDRP